ncbi:restriction endonuclease subunit S [Corallococcus sp. CA054B]|nr:restriction endonuclease subunit S [Corallococcus sp. CA054B]
MPRQGAPPAAYIYWILRTPEYRSYCRGRAIGTTNLSLAREDFLAFQVPETSADRLHLVRLLEALEEKSDLNRRMNRTLEAMAQALFRSWFVDFDPVRAKAEGRRPEGMDAEAAALFPNRFVESELGEIPEGWRARNWGELVTLEYGKALRDYRLGDVPVFGTNGRIGSHDTALCKHEGVVVGRKGAYRGIHYSDEPFFVIDTAFFVEPREDLEMRWAYYELLQDGINSLDSGSAIPSTSRSDFYALRCAFPPYRLQRRFVEILAPMWRRQRQCEQENAALTGLRDALLPKLLSGEIRLRDAETRLAASA